MCGCMCAFRSTTRHLRYLATALPGIPSNAPYLVFIRDAALEIGCIGYGPQAHASAFCSKCLLLLCRVTLPRPSLLSALLHPMSYCSSRVNTHSRFFCSTHHGRLHCECLRDPREQDCSICSRTHHQCSKCTTPKS